MKTLKQLISRYMYCITGTLVAFILVLLIGIQITTEQRRAYSESTEIIHQMESLVGENLPGNRDSEAIEKELSYIFPLFRVNAYADYYAVNKSSGEVVASSNLNIVGAQVTDIGIPVNKLRNAERWFHAKVNGEWSFCVFELCEENYIGRVITAKCLYQRVPATVVLALFCLAIFAYALAMAVVRYMNHHVVEKIAGMNSKLKSIAAGNYEEHLDEQTSAEFEELRKFINLMIRSLLKAEALKRLEVERERDIDALTGLYNRRGLDSRLEYLFAEPQSMGYGAIFMIDGDGLKGINDRLGHEKGDIYLQAIANVISNAGRRKRIAARQGGDEFVLLLYGYDNEDEVISDIKIFRDSQEGRYVELDEMLRVPLRFSMGYCMINAEEDYQTMIKIADEKMYHNKEQRRGR